MVVDGPGQVKLFNDDTRPQVKILADDDNQLIAGQIRGSIRVDLKWLLAYVCSDVIGSRTKMERGSATPIAYES